MKLSSLAYTQPASGKACLPTSESGRLIIDYLTLKKILPYRGSV